MSDRTNTATLDAPDASSSNGQARNGKDRASDNGRRAEAKPGGRMDPIFQVRTADIEPYTGLRYLSKLFRMIAVLLLLMLVAEVITGIVRQGADAIPTLVAEVSRLVVLAGLLWGVGDLVLLLVDVGHDVRAARILLGRQTSHLAQHPRENSAVQDAAAHAQRQAQAAVNKPSAGI